MSTIGLKGNPSKKRIALHTAAMSKSLAKLSARLQAQGHTAEAQYLTMASTACDATAFGLAAKLEG